VALAARPKPLEAQQPSEPSVAAQPSEPSEPERPERAAQPGELYELQKLRFTVEGKFGWSPIGPSYRVRETEASALAVLARREPVISCYPSLRGLSGLTELEKGVYEISPKLWLKHVTK
ncbi:unnamed protein product, partial [Symbiodinium natans]